MIVIPESNQNDGTWSQVGNLVFVKNGQVLESILSIISYGMDRISTVKRMRILQLLIQIQNDL